MNVASMIMEGVGAIALTFIAFTLNDLKSRIVRIENHIFFKGERE